MMNKDERDRELWAEYADACATGDSELAKTVLKEMNRQPSYA